MTAQATPVEANPLSEEQLRAGTYALLAGLLRYPLPKHSGLGFPPGA